MRTIFTRFWVRVQFTLISTSIARCVVPSTQFGITMLNLTSDQLRGVISNIVHSTYTPDVIVPSIKLLRSDHTVRVIFIVSKSLARLFKIIFIILLTILTFYPKISTQLFDITREVELTVLPFTYTVRVPNCNKSCRKRLSIICGLSGTVPLSELLLLLVKDETNPDIRDIFLYFWVKKILPFANPREELVIAVHRYDPFTNNYELKCLASEILSLDIRRNLMTCTRNKCYVSLLKT